MSAKPLRHIALISPLAGLVESHAYTSRHASVSDLIRAAVYLAEARNESRRPGASGVVSSQTEGLV